MRLIKTGAILPFILLLLVTIITGLPVDTGTHQSDSMFAAADLHAQEIEKPGHVAAQDSMKQPEHSATLYQVMGVVLFIWIGLAFFLFRLDRKVARLENQVKNLK